MKMTFRTKRRLRFFGTFFLTVLAVTLVAWFCCVVWLERYIVYSSMEPGWKWARTRQALPG